MALIPNSLEIALKAKVKELQTKFLKGLPMPTSVRNDWRIAVLHQYGGSHDKVYIVTIEDLQNGYFATRGYYGKRTAANFTMQQKVSGNVSVCEGVMSDLIAEKKAKGYLDIEYNRYHTDVPASVRITLEQAMKKIDVTRLVGYAPPSNAKITGKYTNEPAKPAKEPKATKAPPAPKPKPDAGRVTRNIRI